MVCSCSLIGFTLTPLSPKGKDCSYLKKSDNTNQLFTFPSIQAWAEVVLSLWHFPCSLRRENGGRYPLSTFESPDFPLYLQVNIVTIYLV